jgi:hypothetical protein
MIRDVTNKTALENSVLIFHIEINKTGNRRARFKFLFELVFYVSCFLKVLIYIFI